MLTPQFVLPLCDERQAMRPWPRGGLMNDDAAGQGPHERPVGRLDPERADGSEHYWDDRDEELDDEPVCPCCGNDGMDPMTDYALPCPECGFGAWHG